MKKTNRNIYSHVFLKGWLVLFLMLVIAGSLVSQSIANDTAVEIAASGIQLKQEPNISLEREELLISEKITVVYWFKNDTAADVTTYVAFPVPEYTYDLHRVYFIPDFDDFTVEVNGVATPYDKRVQALVNGVDYTALLNEQQIAIEDFDGYDPTMGKGAEYAFINKLAPEVRALFFEKQILIPYQGDETVGWPNWTVALTYYWQQTFPAHSETIITHTYTPYVGVNWYHQDAEGDFYQVACADQTTRQWIYENMPTDESFQAIWVDYILTTANNWQGPIKEFHLTIDNAVESPVGRFVGDHVFVCFDHDLVETRPNHFEAHLQNYVPTQNLRVYYLERPR